MKDITIVIPTLHEKEAIKQVISSVPEERLSEMGWSTEIIVVDGGSSDGTKDQAKKEGARVVEEIGGKASAVRRGLRESYGEVVFTIDGDGSYDPGDIPELLKHLENGDDMVIGSRFTGKMDPESMKCVNYIGNKILTKMANILYGTEVTDLCTGLRGFWKDSIGDVPGYGFEVEAGIHSRFSDANIGEVPIRYRCRKGESKLDMIDGFKIAYRLLREKIKK